MLSVLAHTLKRSKTSRTQFKESNIIVTKSLTSSFSLFQGPESSIQKKVTRHLGEEKFTIKKNGNINSWLQQYHTSPRKEFHTTTHFLKDEQKKIKEIVELTKETKDTQKIEVKDFKIEAKDQEIAEIKKDIKAKDQEIAEIKKDIKAKDQEIAEIRKEIKAKDQEIKAKDQEIKAKDQEIAQARDQGKPSEFIAELVEQRAELKEDKKKLEADKQRLEADIGDLKKDKERLLEEKQKLEQEKEKLQGPIQPDFSSPEKILETMKSIPPTVGRVRSDRSKPNGLLVSGELNVFNGQFVAREKDLDDLITEGTSPCPGSEAKSHSFFALQATPGGGKTRFLHELARRWVQKAPHSTVVSITFNSFTNVSNFKEDIAPEFTNQEMVGLRILYMHWMDLGTNWEGFVKWCWPDRKVSEQFNVPKIIDAVLLDQKEQNPNQFVLLVDEIRLCQEKYRDVLNIIVVTMDQKLRERSTDIHPMIPVISSLDACLSGTSNLVAPRVPPNPARDIGPTGHAVKWFPMSKLTDNDVQRLIPEEKLESKALLLQLRSDCGRHPRFLEILDNNNLIKKLLQCHTYDSVLQRMKDALEERMYYASTIPPELVGYAISGTLVKVNTVLPSHSITVSDALRSGYLINLGVSPVEEFIPKIAPLLLELWVIYQRNKKQQIAVALHYLLNSWNRALVQHEVSPPKLERTATYRRPFEKWIAFWEMTKSVLENKPSVVIDFALSNTESSLDEIFKPNVDHLIYKSTQFDYVPEYNKGNKWVELFKSGKEKDLQKIILLLGGKIPGFDCLVFTRNKNEMNWSLEKVIQAKAGESEFTEAALYEHLGKSVQELSKYIPGIKNLLPSDSRLETMNKKTFKAIAEARNESISTSNNDAKTFMEDIDIKECQYHYTTLSSSNDIQRVPEKIIAKNLFAPCSPGSTTTKAEQEFGPTLFSRFEYLMKGKSHI